MGAGEVADPAAASAAAVPSAMSRWVLPVPESPSSTTRFAVVDPGPGGQMRQGGWGEVGDAGVVEVGEPFGARELGLVNQPDPAAGVAFVAFGGEHLGQERLVRQALLGRRLGQLRRPGRGWWAAARFSQAACDRGLSGRFGQSGHAPRSCRGSGQQLVVAGQRRGRPVLDGLDRRQDRAAVPARDGWRGGPRPRPGPGRQLSRLSAALHPAITASAGRVRCSSSTPIRARVPGPSPSRAAGSIPEPLMISGEHPGGPGRG